MKAFTYRLDLYVGENWRSDWRSGIVVANTKEEAHGLLLEKYLTAKINPAEIIEINLSKLSVEEISQDAWEQ